MTKTGKKVPIKAAREFAQQYGYTEIIIFTRDSETGIQSVCTWGKTLSECENAAEGGNAIKKLLGLKKCMKQTQQLYNENSLNEGYQPTDKLDTTNPPAKKKEKQK